MCAGQNEKIKPFFQNEDNSSRLRARRVCLCDTGVHALRPRGLHAEMREALLHTNTAGLVLEAVER